MPTEDRLVDVTEAAKMLATSEDFLYRHWKQLPFTVWLSKRQLRFSTAGIAQYIAARAGKMLEEEPTHAGPRV
jgi:predicted DNA-binding transcriptional regulator AlpA